MTVLTRLAWHATMVNNNSGCTEVHMICNIHLCIHQTSDGQKCTRGINVVLRHPLRSRLGFYFLCKSVRSYTYSVIITDTYDYLLFV